MKFSANAFNALCSATLTLFLNAALVESAMAHEAGAMDHSMHDHEAMMKAALKRSVVELNIPASKLLRQDGSAAVAQKELASGKPTIVAFIYTSCTTICPMTSRIMSDVQDLLGASLENTRMASVSIDPEYDTPARLQAYAKNLGAAPQWTHYTGSMANSVVVQKAFGAYQGDKMNHLPLMFINGGGKKTWVRLEGFPTAAQVVAELRAQAGE